MSTQVYAHRGGAALWPENTLAAYEKALALGVDAIDMDVGVTRDNVVVVYHDFCLNPAYTQDAHGQFLTDPNSPLHDFTFTELQQFEVGTLDKNSAYGKNYPEQQAIPGTRIPSLKQVIQYGKAHGSPALKFQIEIKSHPMFPEWSVAPEKFAELVAEVIREEGVIERTEIQCFDWRCLLALQKIDERIATAYLTCDTDEAARSPEENLLWHIGYDVKLYNHSWPELISYLGGKIWGPDFQDLTVYKVQDAHERGLKVVPWTVNQLADMRKMRKFEVDGIITNWPNRLKDLLSNDRT